MKRLTLLMCCVALTAPASAGLFGPSSFDECILANMKGVGSDMAARSIAAACFKQFPASKKVERADPKERELSKSETHHVDPRRSEPTCGEPSQGFTNCVWNPVK
jgi:hypothetical protein